MTFRNQYLQPIGIVPYSPRFNSQQLNVREQVSGIYLFQEELPGEPDYGPTSRFRCGPDPVAVPEVARVLVAAARPTLFAWAC